MVSFKFISKFITQIPKTLGEILLFKKYFIESEKYLIEGLVNLISDFDKP